MQNFLKHICPSTHLFLKCLSHETGITWNELWEMLNILWASTRVYNTPFVLNLSVSNIKMPFPRVCFLRYNDLACTSLLIIYYFRTQMVLCLSLNFSRQRNHKLFDLICEMLNSHNHFNYPVVLYNFLSAGSKR